MSRPKQLWSGPWVGPEGSGALLRSPLYRRALLLVALFHLVAMLVYSLPVRLARTDPHRDLIVYYQLLEHIHADEPIYVKKAEAAPHSPKQATYQYPPVFSTVLAMAPAMSFLAFARAWTLLLYAAFWIYALCLAQLAAGRVTLLGALVAGLALTLFPGTHMALSQGQIDPLLWALFGLALVSPGLRGAGLMAVTLVKPWAAWPLLWALRRGWRTVASALAVAGGGLVLGVLVRGPALFYQECLTWLQHVMPSLGQGSWSPWNWSIPFAAIRVVSALGLGEYTGGPLPALAQLWLLCCGIGAPLLAGFYLRRGAVPMQLAAVGCCAVVCAPICWVTYLPVLLTVLALLLGRKIAPPWKTVG